MPFEDFNLPPELLCCVMENMDDPRDLWSFLRASPSGFRAFNIMKDGILKSVVFNSLGPEALRAALAMEHVPHYSGSWREGADEEPQGRFLDQYFDEEYTFRFPDNPKAVIGLCHFVWRIFVLIDCFATSAWTLLHTDLESDGEVPPLVLTRKERAAFQRAFFRFELFTEVFPVYRNSDRKNLVGENTRYSYFLGRMKRWEVTEMSCVQSYYASVISRCGREAEDHFIRCVYACPSLCRRSLRSLEETGYGIHKRVKPWGASTKATVKRSYTRWPPSEEELERRMDDKENWNFFFQFGRYDFDFHFSSFFHHREDDVFNCYTHRVDPITNLRSAYVYQLLRSDQDTRTKLILHTDLRDHEDSFTCWTDLDDSGDVCDPRAGCGYYIFYHTTESECLHMNRCIYEKVRNFAHKERAYALWSLERFHDPAVMESLEHFQNMSDDEAAARSEACNRRCLQYRLSAIGIDSDDIRMLNTRFRYYSAYGDVFRT